MSGYYVSCEGWKPCNIVSTQTLYGEKYISIITRQGLELTLKAWKVAEG